MAILRMKEEQLELHLIHYRRHVLQTKYGMGDASVYAKIIAFYSSRVAIIDISIYACVFGTSIHRYMCAAGSYSAWHLHTNRAWSHCAHYLLVGGELFHIVL